MPQHNMKKKLPPPPRWVSVFLIILGVYTIFWYLWDYDGFEWLFPTGMTAIILIFLGVKWIVQGMRSE